MLVSLEAVIPSAYTEHYAVGAFNVTNIETAQAVLKAAEELKAPVIMQTTEKALDYAGFDILAGVVLNMAKGASVPVVVHLDHGRSTSVAKRCLEIGYTSVMLDFSHQSFAENLKNTKSIVALAKQHGASVEAELGAIAGREDYIENHLPQKTDPKEAAQFVKETGISVLAVGIGNAHGPTTASEKLDFDLLAQIQHQTQFPLVLHGASGNSKEDIAKAISLGVVKINIDTDLRLAFAGALRGYLRANADVYDIRDILGHAREAMTEVVKQKIIMFGSIGKA